MLFKKKFLLEVTYFTGNIYETETATSGLCYIEDLSFLKIIELDFENLCMFSQPIVQWNHKISYLRFLF